MNFSVLHSANSGVLFLIPLLDIKLIKSTRKLLLDLKKDIYSVHYDLASKHGNRFADGEIEEIADAPPVSPRVPEYLEIRFEAALQATNPELKDQARFPLVQGINAFHHHFEQVRSRYRMLTSDETDFKRAHPNFIRRRHL